MTESAWRVAVDNDFAGDPDGLVSLAHLLVGDAVRVELITTSLLDANLAALAGVDAGRTAAAGVIRVEGLYRAAAAEPPPIIAGAESLDAEAANPAAEALVTWSASFDDAPRLLLCGGPLTNIAAALRCDAGLVDRVRLVWIGGALDGGPEYNRDTDAAAAAEVFASAFDIVQIPREHYAQLRYSLVEIADGVGRAGVLGRWLVDELFDVPPFVTLRGALTLGDSALVSVSALDPTLDAVVRPGRRIIADVDPRLLWGDFLTLLRGRV
ncbi:nucleoside hydrolase [Microbacterium sp.]|uniref:nucleoside hydrolase n=1 Tax=Microbacterium sp. TaxID=51671 RepID=UPI003A940F9C